MAQNKIKWWKITGSRPRLREITEMINECHINPNPPKQLSEQYYNML